MSDWEFPDPTSDGLEKARLDPKLARSREDEIARIEDEVHREAASIVSDAMHFADIDVSQEDPPEEWVQALGEKAARRRLKVAKIANLPAKEAPIALKLAKDAMVGMAKVKSGKNAPARTLNMIVVNMTGQIPQFEEIEVIK